MQAARRIKWTEDEYLERERRSPAKNEFLDGEIYAMAGATLRHNTIAANVIMALGRLVHGKPCRTFTSDQRIHVPATGLYTYPDAGILCGKPQLHDKDGMSLLNPLLLVEVLSRSTEDYDRGEKLEHYRNIPSVTEVLLVSTSGPRVDHHRRLEPEQWLLTTCRQGAIEVPSLSGRLLLDDIYDKIGFPEEEEER